MSDMGDIFRDMREVSQKKRARNREASAQMLCDSGIEFERKNHGAHLVVDGRYDFWPGTGKWIHRKTGKKGRGVRGLMKRLQSND